MATQKVGALVVVDAERRPRGVITDRDIVVGVVAAGKGPAGGPPHDASRGGAPVRPAHPDHDDYRPGCLVVRGAGSGRRATRAGLARGSAQPLRVGRAVRCQILLYFDARGVLTHWDRF